MDIGGHAQPCASIISNCANIEKCYRAAWRTMGKMADADHALGRH
jgi:hypothetical protein